MLDGEHLFTIASAAAATDLDNSQVVPGSSLTIEVWSDNTVVGYYVEEPIQLVGCTLDAPCYATDFVAALKAKIKTTPYSTRCGYGLNLSDVK